MNSHGRSLRATFTLHRTHNVGHFVRRLGQKMNEPERIYQQCHNVKTLPGHSDGAVSLQQSGQLDEDVVEDGAESTPLSVVEQQHILQERTRTQTHTFTSANSPKSTLGVNSNRLLSPFGGP